MDTAETLIESALKRRFGEASTCGWSEEKSRHYSDAYRAQFGECIRRRGFKLDSS